MATFSILVVDDDPGIRALLTEVFHVEGYAVQTAENGLQALDAVAQASYDVIITDLDMPRMNGRELARALRTRYVFVPLIVMSADPEYLPPESDLPVAAILRKPFPIATLVSVVASVIEATRRNTPTTVPTTVPLDRSLVSTESKTSS